MKRDWTEGYVADVGYSHGYFHELAPSYLRWHLLVNGHAPPGGGDGFSYCELGYGQGVSANLHAASNPRGTFWGTDFNPSHALHASTLASQAGLPARWLDQSFEALLDNPDTPSFDFIVLHGVWSWVSAGAHHAIVEFIRRRLKVGGAVFISYNIQPGWAAEQPLRDLLWLHTEEGSAPGAPTPRRIAGALAFARALRSHGSAFFTENTRASQALDDMLRQEPGSLAHEYFNRSWWITHFSDVARTLQAASLDFACSIHISDAAGEVRDRLAGASFLNEATGTPLRETAADYMLNRRFRRDVFVRGARMLGASERLEQLDEVRFVLMRPAESVPMFISTPYGQLALDEPRARALLRALHESAKPLSFAQLRGLDAFARDEAEDLLLLLNRLVTSRQLSPVFADDAAHAHQARAHALNEVLARRARHDNTIRYLASPVAAGGVEASRFERLFWLAWHGGGRTAADLARGAVAAGAAAQASELEPRAEEFLRDVAPVWARLGLLDARPARARK